MKPERICAFCHNSATYQIIYGVKQRKRPMDYINTPSGRIDFCDWKCKEGYIKKHTVGTVDYDNKIFIKHVTMFIMPINKSDDITDPNTEVYMYLEARCFIFDNDYNKGVLQSTKLLELNETTKTLTCDGKLFNAINAQDVVEKALENLRSVGIK